MRARIREITEVEFEIDPSIYPEEVDSWETALEWDRTNEEFNARDFSEVETTVEAELLGDPDVEPWPGGGP